MDVVLIIIGRGPPFAADCAIICETTARLPHRFSLVARQNLALILLRANSVHFHCSWPRAALPEAVGPPQRTTSNCVSPVQK